MSLYFIPATVLGTFLLTLCLPGHSKELTRTIQTLKSSVVGIGTFERTRSPSLQLSATGFVVGDGLSVLTNAHSIPAVLDSANRETLGVLVGQGEQLTFRPATLAGIDREHDLAHLRLSGTPLPALRLGDSDTVLEGQDFAFTGFPLGMVLGLHAATHRATLSAITPVVMPSASSGKLDVKTLKQLQRARFKVFQLDATAYPGNSGSPLYDPATGTVYGVINMVFIKGLKESAISNPSGISYAIPANFARDLLQTPRP